MRKKVGYLAGLSLVGWVFFPILWAWTGLVVILAVTVILVSIWAMFPAGQPQSYTIVAPFLGGPTRPEDVSIDPDQMWTTPLCQRGRRFHN